MTIMSRKKEGEAAPGQVTRRQFIRNAGIVAGGTAIGSTFLVSACEPEKEKVYAEVPKSDYIEWDPAECAVCSRCLMACSAYHSGAMAPQLSGIKWVDAQEFYGYDYRKPLFCHQCSQPECYFACPEKDEAQCIDENTGIRYVNHIYCN